MSGETIIVRFEIRNPPTQEDPYPLGGVRLQEELHIDIDRKGMWEVTNPEARPEWKWIGRNENRHMAILDYLRARLGLDV